MKKAITSILLICAVCSYAQNSTSVAPDAGSQDTSIMGGGTPGNQGIDTLDMKQDDEDHLNKVKQEQEKRKSKKEINTDQNSEADTI